MKTSKKLLMLGATLSLSALLFGCSKEETKEVLPAEEPKEIVRKVPKSEGKAEETTTDTESEATSAVENSDEMKETSTIPEADIQAKGLELIKADYDAFLKGEAERAALPDTYHPTFKEEDRKVELPKLEANLESALAGKKIDDIQWTQVDASIVGTQKSGEGADYKDMYGLTVTAALSTSDGGMYYDARTYVVKEYNNELRIIYVSSNQPAQKLQ